MKIDETFSKEYILLDHSLCLGALDIESLVVIWLVFISLTGG